MRIIGIFVHNAVRVFHRSSNALNVVVGLVVVCVKTMKRNNDLRKCVPISLKLKKEYDLVAELRIKDIVCLVDARRKPVNRFNSAEQYFPNNLKKDMFGFGITYFWFPLLGNYRKATLAEDYYATLPGEVKMGLKTIVITNFTLFSGRVGFLCYCTEEAQKDGKCHAAWLCDICNPLYEAVT